MRKPSIHDLVYHKTHPKPRQNDPVSFFAHVQRNLVPEVRIEVQMYYGAIDSLEAQYPGLDYTLPAHRKRMSKHPWHRRLFRVFDELGLTSDEILGLCQWEGTRAAKERYERDANQKINVTTLKDVMAAPEGRRPRAIFHHEQEESLIALKDERREQVLAGKSRESTVDVDEEDELDSSVGIPLNEQLRAAADARARGEPAAFDEQWEQWMKEALERNEMDVQSILDAVRQGQPYPTISAEEGQMVVLQDFQHEAENNLPPEFSREMTPTLSTTVSAVAPRPQSYDELHNMLDELQSNNNRLAADNAAMAHFLSRSRTETAR